MVVVGFFGNRDNDGLLEACGDYRLKQCQVEKVCEDICQLICTHLESSARNAIRSRCLACVNPFMRPILICPGYYRWAGVLGLLYLHSQGIALNTCIESVGFIWEKCRHYISTAGFHFVVSDGIKSSPHVSGVGALVLRLHFAPVLSLSTANSSPERVPLR